MNVNTRTFVAEAHTTDDKANGCYHLKYAHRLPSAYSETIDNTSM
jgi:hypothetical protein